MTTLKSKLQEDLNAAIKERDELRSSTLRLTLTAITKEEVAGKDEARALRRRGAEGDHQGGEEAP